MVELEQARVVRLDKKRVTSTIVLRIQGNKEQMGLVSKFKGEMTSKQVFCLIL